MQNRIDDKIKNSVDWFTLAIYLIMVLCGWFSIYGASYQYGQTTSMFDISGRAGMQLIWMGSSLVIAFILLKLDGNIYDILAYYLYILIIILLIVTIFIAPDVKGSRSWINITSSIRLQPAEFAKFAVALALAKYMSAYGFKLLNIKNIFVIFTIIALPIVLILLQKETGSALVFTVFILVIYREGLPSIILLLALSVILFFIVGLKYSEVELGYFTQGEFISALLIIIFSIVFVILYQKRLDVARNIFLGSVVIIGLPFLVSLNGVNVDWGIVALVAIISMCGYLIFLAVKYWSASYLFITLFSIFSMIYVNSIDLLFNKVLEPHQQKRIKVVLGMEEDLTGAGYNVYQSKIAIGSGGFLGKGFLNGTQTKLKYVPEQDTDFIFCTVGEEQGFVGATLVLILYLILICRLIYLAERQRNTFGRIYGYCVACILFFHLAINIGMVIGLAPVIGIPLPFFSYGGSSLWAFTILLFIFLRIDMTRKRR